LGVSARGACDVLHVVPAYFPSRGGIEVLVETLVERLDVSLNLSSSVVAPAVPGTGASLRIHRGTRVHSLVDQPGIEPGMTPWQARSAVSNVRFMADLFGSIRGVLASEDPRLVHIHGIYWLGMATATVASSMDVPVLMHVHGSLTGKEPRYVRDRLRDAPWMCAVSDAVRTSVARECDRTKPIHLVRNGVEDPLATTRPFASFSPSVAMVGRLSPEKGFDDGLRALQGVRTQLGDLRVRLVGAGPEATRLRELAASLDMLDCLDYYGQLRHGDALRVILGSDVVLIPSTGIEGFSLVAAESALLGRPVVATTAGGLPETVLDDVTGLLVAPGDRGAMEWQLLRLLVDPALRNTLGQQARRRALGDFTLGRFVSDIAEMYATMWGNSPGSMR